MCAVSPGLGCLLRSRIVCLGRRAAVDAFVFYFILTKLILSPVRGLRP